MEMTVDEPKLLEWGEQLGRRLKGGECIELVGDVGAGKTTFTKALAKGMGIDDDVQSPTFTLSRVYETDTISLHHYDFYRLNDAGVMAYELAESVQDPRAVVIVEWADTVADVLPEDRLVISLQHTADGVARRISINSTKYEYLYDFMS